MARRRRSQIEVWPAYADLFSALTVVGLAAMASMSAASKKAMEKEKIIQTTCKKLEESQFKCSENDRIVVDESLLRFPSGKTEPEWYSSDSTTLENLEKKNKFFEIVRILLSNVAQSDQVNNVIVQFEGYTDCIPIRSDMKGAIRDNSDLSALRASTIIRIVRTDPAVGLPEDVLYKITTNSLKLQAVGMGDQYLKTGANSCDAYKGKILSEDQRRERDDTLSANRRIEIRLVPADSASTTEDKIPL